MRNIGIILTDWQEIKDAGGITSQEESLKSLQETGTPLYGFCLKTAKDTLQDDMGAFLRKTGGSFQIFNEGKKDTQLTDLNINVPFLLSPLQLLIPKPFLHHRFYLKKNG